MDYEGPTEELPKMSYEEFCTGAQALVDQLKIDRELVRKVPCLTYEKTGVYSRFLIES